MKSLGLVLLCLFGTSVWANDDAAPVSEDPSELDIPVAKVASLADRAVPIFVPTYSDDDFALSAATKVNWYQAQAACASQDYTLVSLETLTKQNRVFSFLLKSGLLTLLTEPVWTSGTNLALSSVWSWFSNGNRFKYRNFQNNPGSSYRCVGFNSITAYWTAEDCNSQRYFVCEKRCKQEL